MKIEIKSVCLKDLKVSHYCKNYCKTHGSDQTRTEVSVTEHAQSSTENQHQENTLSNTLAQRHPSDGYEAEQGTDPA